MSAYIENIFYATDLTELATDVGNGDILPVPNQLAWITGTEKFYKLLPAVDGSNVAHWKDLQLEVANFIEYVPANAYAVGNAVRVGQVLYVCIDAAAAGESPSLNPEKWLVLQSASEFVVIPFTAQDTVTVNHTLNLVSVEVYVTRSTKLVQTMAHVELQNATQFIVNFASAETGEIRIR